MTDKALVLFSGGQDSTVCLAWALDRFETVESVSFDYDQRHKVELEIRQRVLERIEDLKPQWQGRLGTDHPVRLAELAQISDTALTRDQEIEMAANGLPTTFVPGRNIVFFTYAAAIAYRRGITTLVGGMCETDYSGYPDCRAKTINSMAETLSLGMDRPYAIETPLMYLDKAATWELADQIGGKALVDLIIEDTHTCYLGDRTKKHAWGYGCGECPACQLRQKGFEKWQAGAN